MFITGYKALRNHNYGKPIKLYVYFVGSILKTKAEHNVCILWAFMKFDVL